MHGDDIYYMVGAEADRARFMTRWLRRTGHHSTNPRLAMIAYEIATSGDGSYSFTRFAVARFGLNGGEQTLELYWLEGYGGGLFLPFRDGTSGKATYGAGRYLLDTVKGADLGGDLDPVTGRGTLVADLNFAYNPSCAYDPAWMCPLAPPGNTVAEPVAAGELYPLRDG